MILLEGIRAKQGVGKQNIVPNTGRGSGRQYIPKKILQLFPSFKLTQNCFINMNISFP